MEARVALPQRMMEGFAVAALAQGDADGARALPGLTAELAEPAARRAFLHGALGRPALDASWAARLARAENQGFRAAPELIAYLARLSRAR